MFRNRSNLAAFIALLGVLGGLFVGLYVGVWWGFIGGIVTVIESAKLDPVNSMGIAWGVFRFVAAGTLGSLAGIGVFFGGAAIASSISD